MVLKQSERDFQAQLMQVVRMFGGLAYHTYDSRRSPEGYPDLTIVTTDRRVIWAELKAGKRQPTDDQWIWLRSLPGHQAYLWRPDDWDDAVRIIQDGHRLDVLSPSPPRKWLQPAPDFDPYSERTCIACQGGA